MRKIWENADGTYSHRLDPDRKWDDLESCATDLRFCEEYGQ